jgi:hypothetical protein
MIMTIYLKDATYIDWKTLAFESGHLAVGAVDDGGIRFLDALPPEDERGVDDRVLDCSRRLVTKSFGCGSTQFFGNSPIYLVASG